MRRGGESAAAVSRLQPLPRAVLATTSGNGTEFARHEAIARALGADFYFADSYAAWQRGANENANGLMRQFFPKGSGLGKVSDEELERVMDLLNNRPRRCLGWKTPTRRSTVRARRRCGLGGPVWKTSFARLRRPGRFPASPRHAAKPAARLDAPARRGF